MFRTIIPVLFLFLGLYGLSAQPTTRIALLDSKTNEPIVGAFYAYDTLQFGVSDDQGRFELQVVDKPLALRISHLAYVDTVLLVSGEAAAQTIYLKAASIALPEIRVNNERPRKFRNPVQLLKQALRAVPENYLTTTAYPIGHYRETILHAGCPVSNAEGVFEYRLSPYGKKHSHRKAWASAWDRRYASYPRPFDGRANLFFDHAEGTQHYAGVEDAYRPIQTRYAERKPPLEKHMVFTDGPLDLIALDKVRLGYDFLSPQHLRAYTYTLVDSVVMNGAYCYHLTFRPKSSDPTRYHALSKTPKVAAFSGDIYLSIRQLAIVRYTAWNSKVVARNFSDRVGRTAPIGSLRLAVDYAKDATDRWQLQAVEAITDSPVDSAYRAVRNLRLTTSSTDMSAAAGSFWYGFNFLNHLHNLTYQYDSSFWSAFARSSLASVLSPIDDGDCSVRAADFSYAHDLTRKKVLVPRVNPRGNLNYVKAGQQRKRDWAWLEEATDSATLNYLRWENDYYDQYFLRQRPLLDTVAQQFSRAVQGLPADFVVAKYPDTTFERGPAGLGFYVRKSEDDQQRLVSVDEPPAEYRITEYSHPPKGRYYLLKQVHRNYDALLTIYDHSGPVAELSQVDDYLWKGDTLYATTNNALLRTAGLHHWTASGGWVEVLQEPRTDYEYRLQRLSNGEVILIVESLRDATILRKRGTDWIEDQTVYSALTVGTGPDGTGCRAEVDVDFILDCRTKGTASCLIAVKDARQSLYVRRSPEAEWRQIKLPSGTLAAFVNDATDPFTISFEAAGRYGQRARVDVETVTLVPAPTPFPVIDLAGYSDSIIEVKSADGTLIPCQLRWKTELSDQLKSTLLKVYGAYGNPSFAGHSEADIALMNLGVAIVYVHPRGGGIRGPNWYDAGRAEYKERACADYLAAVQYFKASHPLMTTPLSGYAQSAGGPILGALVNRHPALLTAAVFDHAFLDVAGVMQRPELPLTQYEYLEWGNPANKKVRQIQASYSPFSNLRTQAYPAMLFSGGLHDQSTPYWQIAKHVAALRWLNDRAPNTIFRTNLRGSHPGTPFGPSQAQLYEQIAFLLAAVEGGE
ncbi:MAG: prolyl oligopeptidase family serine peptidase [Bacteroidota bacterium]